MDNYITCKDVNGQEVTINIHTLGEFTLFGMSWATIAELRRQYLLRYGPLPITKDSVRLVFDN